VLDRERILSKIDELDSYIKEIKQISPSNFNEYQDIKVKRSCERLLQLGIECIIDICKLFVSGLRLGLPSEENDLFNKMLKENILTAEMVSILKGMRGFRNILVHEYAAVDDELVFEAIRERLDDFKKFKKEVLNFLK
jgi:uncharacterized protein YutE (UPF0331/DUF86 family)